MSPISRRELIVLKKIIESTTERVEEFLRELRAAGAAGKSRGLRLGLDQVIADVGIRLRPALLRLSYESGGYDFGRVIPIAAGVEFVQHSTLILDDILDESGIRNEGPSIVGEWGQGVALVSGIIIASSGFSMITDGVASCATCSDKTGAVKMLHDTHRRIYVGQEMDLEMEGEAWANEAWYLEMIGNTTACFIEMPLVLGALLWDAPKALLDGLSRTGYNLGMAYQIRDDVIDVLGDPELTGKPRAGDIRQRKMRLPVIHAIANARPDAAADVRALYSQGRQLTDSEIERVTDVLTEAGSIDYTIAKAREYCQAAIEETRRLPTGNGRLAESLAAVAHLIGSFDEEPNGELV